MCYSLAFSNPFEDLLGKTKSYLDKNDFYCHPTSCIAQEQNYFDNTVLDDVVEHIEAFFDNNQIVYKIIIHLYHNQKMKDQEINNAFYQSLLEFNKKNSQISYELLKVNDKYGNKMMVVIKDKSLTKKYMLHMKKSFIEALSAYKAK